MKAEVVRSLIIMRRYWLATLIGLIIGYGMIIALIWAFTVGSGSQVATSIRKVAIDRVAPAASSAGPQGPLGTASGEEQPPEAAQPAANAAERGAKIMNGVLGFVIGLFAFGVIGMFAQGLAGMAQSGELEQLCMSPHGLVGNFLARSLVTALNSILSSTILVLLVSHTIPDASRLAFRPGY